MSDERDKLLQVMSSLESDYNSGKISSEKYRYFRSKYEDKLNSIDAMEATRRIRSMQGKSTAPKNKNRSKKPANYRKKQEQDLVQKYIINPKKDDVRYNKQKKSSVGGGAFKFIAILVLIVAFTAGVAYGIFNLDTGSVASGEAVATVQDTAFPEIVAVVNNTVANYTSNTNNNQTAANTNDNVETTTETTTDTSTDSSSSSSSDSSSDSSSSDVTPTPSPSPTPSGDDSGGDGGGSSDDSGGSEGGNAG